MKLYLEIKSWIAFEMFWFTKRAKWLDLYNRTEGQLRALEFGQ